ncbi:IS66 family insertion sequence element accessory protein TnpB [Ruegeria atlantica]|uniref:IS66 family insertion sequence element accessory protein TnpB n=1 Tax=Ruegeria atlantica TaxID=81569 RepID=UPI00147AF809|nr:IS66 family insertion sequence element accessory protein TnpB [Ruegeria atlantica]
MRREFNTLAAQAEKLLTEDPYSGHLFVFRDRRGYLLKIIWWDQQGACLFTKRLEMRKADAVVELGIALQLSFKTGPADGDYTDSYSVEDIAHMFG